MVCGGVKAAKRRSLISAAFGQRAKPEEHQHAHLRQFQRGTRKDLLCQPCDEKAAAKDKRLLKRWRTSKKQKCKCGFLIHAEKCFMWWSGLGPHPYCGMDVLDREDYERLLRRGKMLV